MTAVVDPDYATDVTGGNRTKAQGKAIMRQMLALMRETIGGGAEGATVTLASDTATIVNNACIFGLDTEGAAASDNCKAITIGVSGDLRDGMVVGFYNVNSARSITFKNIAGARRIFTKSGRDVVIADTVTIFWAKYKLADDAWYQIIPDVSNMVDLLAGGQPLSTVSISSSAITISSALILVDSASAMHLDQILSSKHAEGNLVGLCSANALQTRTLYHNVGTDDKLDLIGAANIVMAANTWYFFVKTIVSSHVIWKHVWTIYPQGVIVVASTAAGKLAVANGSGGYRETGGTLAKGKLPVGADANDFGYLATDTDGKVLTLDSTQTLGVKWATPSAGGSLYGDGADGAKTISTNTTETVPKDFRLTTLTIQTGCTWTVKSGTLIMCTGAVDIQGTGKLVVSADIPGGTAGNASGLIRQNGSGPSPGTCSAHGIYSVPSGGGCGGPGGDGGFIAAGSMPGGKGGAAIAPAPGVTGSGGGAGYYGGNPAICGNGGNGGGSVGLYSGSTINIAASAKITANGTDGSAQSTTYGVAGAGGSGGVIDIGALISITNSGTIEAKGGLGGNAVNSGYFAPGGGGGLVNLTAPSITAGTITLTGGAKGSGGTAHDVSPTNGSTGVTYSTSAAPVKHRCF